MPRKIESYQCTGCQEIYGAEIDAIECERRHMIDSRVSSMKFQGKEPYPVTATITFPDGHELEYKRCDMMG